jgi:hypothetical protein
MRSALGAVRRTKEKLFEHHPRFFRIPPFNPLSFDFTIGSGKMYNLQ